MPFLRTAIVVGVVIALLPSDRAQQERLQQAVFDAASWTVTFCDRNRKTCENAAAGWEVFKAKAEFAGLVAYDIAMTHIFAPGAQLAAPSANVETSAVVTRGTLTSRDLEPGWRGAPPR